MTWIIVITWNGEKTGKDILATGWDVFSKIAAIRIQLPTPQWKVDAYPQFTER